MPPTPPDSILWNFSEAEQATFRPPKLPDAEVIEEFARQMTKHGIDANCLLPHGNYLGTRLALFCSARLFY
jgi:hypothetical protein